jgi:hypothetical protein
MVNLDAGQERKPAVHHSTSPRPGISQSLPIQVQLGFYGDQRKEGIANHRNLGDWTWITIGEGIGNVE